MPYCPTQPHPDLRRRGLLEMGLGLSLGLGVAPHGRAAEPPAYEWRPWPAGRVAPPLNLAALDGSRWRLADQRGKVLMANFWATWCEPCRAEMPSLLRLAARHAAAGMAVVAINYRESAVTVRRFLDATALAMPVLLDADGKAAVAWTPLVFPTTVIFDRRGRPAGSLVGEIDWEGPSASALLAPLLAKG